MDKFSKILGLVVILFIFVGITYINSKIFTTTYTYPLYSDFQVTNTNVYDKIKSNYTGILTCGSALDNTVYKKVIIEETNENKCIKTTWEKVRIGNSVYWERIFKLTLWIIFSISCVILIKHRRNIGNSIVTTIKTLWNKI